MSIYIPPENFGFRLEDFKNDLVLVADKLLRAYPKSQSYPDQWFTFEQTTSEYGENLYYVKSQDHKFIGQYISIVLYPLPGLGMSHKQKGVPQRFSLDFGTGDFKGTFRLQNNWKNVVIGARSQDEVYLHPANEEHWSDQYFSLEFEETIIDRVEYDVVNGKIHPGEPIIVSDQVINDNSRDVVLHANLSQSQTFTCSFGESHGFTITTGAEASFGVPGISGGKIKLDVSNTHNYQWGRTYSEATTVGSSVDVPVPANSKVTVTGSIEKGEITMPCTIYSKSKKSGVEVATKSTYKGLAFWGFKYQIGEATPILLK